MTSDMCVRSKQEVIFHNGTGHRITVPGKGLSSLNIDTDTRVEGIVPRRESLEVVIIN